MSVDPKIIAAAKKALLGAASLGYNSKAQSHDVYEAYTMSLVVQVARAASGISIDFESGEETR